MKAQIIKCSNPNAWYADKIGKQFEIFEQSKFLPFTSVFDEDGKARIVNNEDIIILN